jgi:hypothetical protein
MPEPLTEEERFVKLISDVEYHLAQIALSQQQIAAQLRRDLPNLATIKDTRVRLWKLVVAGIVTGITAGTTFLVAWVMLGKILVLL